MKLFLLNDKLRRVVLVALPALVFLFISYVVSSNLGIL